MNDNIIAYLNKIEDKDKRIKVSEILNHILNKFTSLKLEYKYNQPMFVDHGTFILALSVATNHISIAPEMKTMKLFKDKIDKSNYSQTERLFRIKFSDEINYDLIDEIVAYNIDDKALYNKFWR